MVRAYLPEEGPPAMPDAHLEPRPLLAGPFYFVRHGQSEANVLDIIAGSIEPDLTPRGREQADRAGRLLKLSGAAAIIASPQQRAADTAAAIAAHLDLPVVFEPDLVERRWGVWESRPVASRPHYFIDPLEGESWPVFLARTRGVLERLAPPAPAILVAHSGTQRAIRAILGHDPGGEGVANGLPIRFSPPAEAGMPWAMLPIDAEGWRP